MNIANAGRTTSDVLGLKLIYLERLLIKFDTFDLLSIINTFVFVMKTVQADDSAQEEILRAAIRLYRKYGPARVTMDEVAIASGRSRTSLYYYYKNRDEIFQAVLETIVDDVTIELRHDVNNAGNIREKIHALCLSKIKTSENWRNVFKAMWASMNAEEKTKHSKNMEMLHSKLVYNEGLIIKEILSESIYKNEIRPITATEQDMLSFILSSSIRGLRNEIYEKNDPHDLKDALRLLSDIVTKWIAD